MARVRLVGVGFAHPDSPALLSSVDLDIRPGFTGVAGPNGAGKTTLLRLVAGDLSPTAGTIHREPADLVIARLDQAPAEVSELVSGFAWSWDGQAGRLRGRLGLDAAELERWSSLSPGERQRWQVAAALHLDPDVLLLDEPTNHLDREARRELADALRGFGGIALVVSHDRTFLDALAAATIWVDGGRVELRSGSYTEAREHRESEQASVRRRRKVRARRLDRLERESDQRARRAASSARAVRSRTRMKGPRDSDGRSVARKGRADKAAASHAQAAGALRGRVERARAELETTRFDRKLGGDVSIGHVRARSSVLLRAELTAVRRGERELIACQTVTIGREDRIRLVGRNGSGKTTLIEQLVACWPDDRLLHLPQELAADQRRVAAEDVRCLAPDERGRCATILASLGVEPTRAIDSDAPSPGEARKLLLASALARRAHALVLDEPENHLDAPSIERLEAALAAYAGALLLVTHDDRLGDALTTTRWRLEDGRVIV